VSRAPLPAGGRFCIESPTLTFVERIDEVRHAARQRRRKSDSRRSLSRK